jgi:DNA-binding GntR family transcriptional regulator
VSADETDPPRPDGAGSQLARWRLAAAGIVSEHENLGSALYLTLAEKIVRGHFRPDERVRIRELADRLGTSVTPVRDAVLRLVQDRALVMRSARDIRVPVLTSRQYLEIRAIRLELEGLAAATAADRVDGPQLDDLAGLIADNEAALADGDAETATELNQVFHFRLAELAQMPTLCRILQRLWLQVGPVIAELYGAAAPGVVRHHHAVLNALSEGDGPAAAHAIRTDILECGLPILEHIRSIEAATNNAREGEG